jgi:hypothetical protein
MSIKNREKKAMIKKTNDAPFLCGQRGGYGYSPVEMAIFLGHSHPCTQI